MNRSNSKIRHIQEANLKLEQSFVDSYFERDKAPDWVTNRFKETKPKVKTKPKTKSEIINFQNWVINTKKDKQILGNSGADGFWGQRSELAWNRYGAYYNPSKIKPKNTVVNNKIFKTFDDVRKFQNWVINVKKDRRLIGSADGDWGPKTKAAWNKYGTEYLKTNKNTNTVADTGWLKNVSGQVRKQVEFLKSKNFNQPFTVLDDKNSIVYAVNKDYSLHKSYKVITGRDRGDEVKAITFKDWFLSNPLDNFWTGVKAFWEGKWGNKLQAAATALDNAYFGTKFWVTKNTPAGVFRADKGVSNWLEDKILTTFAEKDYGRRFIGFTTLSGKQLAVGFHGTKNPQRIKIGEDDWTTTTKRKKGNVSFGCVNFKDSDIQNIAEFITNGQYSFWLPDTSNEIVSIPTA